MSGKSKKLKGWRLERMLKERRDSLEAPYYEALDNKDFERADAIKNQMEYLKKRQEDSFFYRGGWFLKNMSGGLTKDEIYRVMHQKYMTFFAISIGILGAIFFLSQRVTGNVISEAPVSTFSLFGIGFLIFCFIAFFIWIRKSN